MDHAFQCVYDVVSCLCALDVRGSALFLQEVVHDFVQVISLGYIDGDKFSMSSAVTIKFMNELFNMVFLVGRKCHVLLQIGRVYKHSYIKILEFAIAHTRILGEKASVFSSYGGFCFMFFLRFSRAMQNRSPHLTVVHT